MRIFTIILSRKTLHDFAKDYEKKELSFKDIFTLKSSKDNTNPTCNQHPKILHNKCTLLLKNVHHLHNIKLVDYFESSINKTLNPHSFCYKIRISHTLVC